jgi:hypothetical protein
MRRLAALRLGLLVCGTWAGLGCGPRFVGRVSRDGAAPPIEAGAQMGPDGGADVGRDGGADAVVDLGPEGPPLPPADLPPVCTVDGWCWTHPLPSGDRFVDAFQVAADDVWLVGAAGTIVRFAGGKLSAIPSPTSTLAAIWATEPDDVWVGGRAGQYHWDGEAWSQIGIRTSPTARGVNAFWGCAPNDIWAMGPIATRWDGQDWLGVKVPSDVLLTESGFHTVWGSACDDVWAGSLLDSSGAGAIYHFDGSTWAKVEARPAEEISGIGRSDVWSLAQGRLFHSNGVDPGVLVSDRTVSLSAIGTGAVGIMNDARRVLLLGSDGASTLLPAPAPDATRTLRGWASDDLWALGALGTAAHWNGMGWERHLPAWLLSSADATRVTGSGPDDLWAVVGGGLLHGDGKSWQIARTADQLGGSIVDLWVPGPGQVWVLGGDDRIHRFVSSSSSSSSSSGGQWETDDPPAGDPTASRMRAISGTGPNDVWIARGTNSVVHWDGDDWIARDVTLNQGGAVNTINAIWAAAPNDLWVVGSGISHWVNGSWVGAPAFPSNVVPVNGPYVAVAGTGPNDVFFLSASGAVVKATNDNLTLTQVSNPGAPAVALVAAAPTGVWLLFDDVASGVSRLTLLGSHSDGGADPRLVAPAGLKGIWCAPDGTLWAAGQGGSLLRRAPTP